MVSQQAAIPGLPTAAKLVHLTTPLNKNAMGASDKIFGLTHGLSATYHHTISAWTGYDNCMNKVAVLTNKNIQDLFTT